MVEMFVVWRKILYDDDYITKFTFTTAVFEQAQGCNFQ